MNAEHETAEGENETTEQVRCECDEWSHVYCEAIATRKEMVTVRWVPLFRRAMAREAGSSYGMHRSLLVSTKCAKFMVECEPDWIEVQS